MKINVREIVYHKTPRANEEYRMGGYQRHLCDEDMQLVQTALRNTRFVGQKTDSVVNMLINDKIRGIFLAQALTTIVISGSTNLISLAMTRPFNEESFLWWFPGRCNEDDYAHFSLDKFLRHANVDPEGKPYLDNLRDVYIINEYPTLKNVHDNYYRTDFMGCLPFSGHLLAIEFVVKQDLHQPFLFTPCLLGEVDREFQYRIGGRAPGGHGHHFFTPLPVFKLRYQHKNTLESLDLDVESHLPMLKDWDDKNIEDDSVEMNPGWLTEEEEALEFRFLTSIWKLEGSLQDLSALKSLSIGIGLLLFFTRGVHVNPKKRRASFTLADCLPGNLEFLCIQGYEKGLNETSETQMDHLLAYYKSGNLNLKEITGIE
ncbi:uncharacterized protein N7496_007862 [Penicillium cataractarum]|uniref:Uncharacterized protein n=1 Tax=Penicillium cataractarum TaxID=2100454 RepID=A0A9W9RXI9_9EURO|nr:uncharacterized protein N7496_007862 [Penicillium cataractarum]KAJ5368102.1 hypothetical protein N7496_007862 [Penicillium cataractarum]